MRSCFARREQSRWAFFGRPSAARTCSSIPMTGIVIANRLVVVTSLATRAEMILHPEGHHPVHGLPHLPQHHLIIAG